ncbi:ORF3 [Torque teno sus virus k2b]|uniref:ORF3 n=1 Tax=Torque teno sus virus k2 (isolate Pig/New Zealand/38E05/2007) TaxID=1239832 RepID=K4I3C7_TTVK2|nr:ORF3 [Torque teno sus virus k2b]AFU64569.1 ORF3 [Torque teno sus virus k2b]AFU64573.1 ORF3 [Torque teno sus virus k2b]
MGDVQPDLHYRPRTPGRITRWLDICRLSHHLFCPCKNWKGHLQLCLRSEDVAGDGGDTHATAVADFDLGGIEDLIAAAESGEATERSDLKQPLETPKPFPAQTFLTQAPAPSEPGSETLSRYIKESCNPGNMTMMGLFEQILSDECYNTPRRRTKHGRKQHRSVGLEEGKGPSPIPAMAAIPAVPKVSITARKRRRTKRRRRRDKSTSSDSSTRDESSSSFSDF